MADNNVTSIGATTKGSTKEISLTAIWQRWLRVLDATYFERVVLPKTAELDAIGTICATTGQRLAAL